MVVCEYPLYQLFSTVMSLLILQSLVKTSDELLTVSSQERQTVMGISQEQEEINKMAAEEVEGNVSKEVFTTYTPKHSVFSTSRPHPADIVEAASLAVSGFITLFICIQ